jgi:hypothetical protein
MEEVFPIEFHIPSLKLAVQLFPDTSSLEECLLYLEQRQGASLANEALKKKIQLSV